MSNRSSHFANRLQTMISAIRAAPLRVLLLAVAVAGLMTVAELPSAAPVHAQEQAVTATGQPDSSNSLRGPLNGERLIINTVSRPFYGLSPVFRVSFLEVVTNTAPAFTTGADFSMEENQAISFTVTATDDDGDEVTYAITGGADQLFFAINATSGLLAIPITLDHENPSDADGNNVYLVTVTATGGTGARALTTDQAITVTVNDVDEPPSAPAAPTVSAVSDSSDSLSVSWTAPNNSGKPDIDSYDLQYRKGTTGNFADGPQDVTVTTDTITGLDADSAYQVQVRATNDEGDGAWSSAGSGTTNAQAEELAETTVPADWSLIPTGLGAGDRFRLIFISSTTRDATATAIGDYNTFVQTAASNGHADIQSHSSTFRVVGSTAGVDARDNTATTYTNDDKGVAIYWLGGNKVADEYEDFYDGDWDDEANAKDESGSDRSTSLDTDKPLTGSDHNGTEAFSGSSSRALGASSVQLGSPNSSTSGYGPLGSNFATLNSNSRPFYSLSPVFRVEGQVVTNTAPAFTTGADFATNENQAAMFQLTAMDADAGDEVTYAVTGGADQGLLVLNATSGLLAFPTGYDHENPSDADSNNVYLVTVTATGGTGARALMTDQAITVTVLDVDEPPSAPAAPTVSAVDGSSDSLSVTWTAPDNTGKPDIASYDLQYRKGTTGNWIDGPQGETGTTATISGLDADSAYQVQVRATNDEGDGAWSSPGSGTTNAAINTAPAFTTVADFSVNENDGIALQVTAMDDDAGDDVTYAITGGADQSLFQINATNGILAIPITPDHENPVDADSNNVYLVTVTATGGTGARALTTDQAITVTVNDVIEPPRKPSAPTVEAVDGTTDSLSVTWTAPDNTGRPSIDSYDLQYRKGTTGNWIDGPQDETGTTATISGLDEDSAYQVQVRATNDEGDGAWSSPGSGSTNAPAEELAETTVPADWGLIPSGLGAGDGFRLLFIGTSERNANASDIADYNTFVQNLVANNGHADIKALSATFQMVGSTEAVDARDNTGTMGTGVPIYWLGGAKVADDYADFYDGGWDEEAAGRWETGASVTIGTNWKIWTGSAHDGTEAMSTGATPTSRALGNSNNAWVMQGSPNGSNSAHGPIESDTISRTNNRYVYGLSLVFRVSDQAIANNPPAFSSAASFSVEENQTDAGTVMAEDADAVDTVTYAVTGGADQALFQIDAASGALTFATAPDHENPADAGRNNTYMVTVTATSGTGDRALTTEQTITVTVTDVDETPTFDGLEVTSTPKAEVDTYGRDETIEVTVTFDQAVRVTGTPRLRLRIGGGNQEHFRWADYAGGTGTTALRFTYVVQEADMDSDGIFIEASELFLNSGTIQGVDDDVAADLAYPRQGGQSGHKVDGSLRSTNTDPAFDQESAVRDLPENTGADEYVGDPLTATDDDGDTLTYSLEGAGQQRQAGHRVLRPALPQERRRGLEERAAGRDRDQRRHHRAGSRFGLPGAGAGHQRRGRRRVVAHAQHPLPRGTGDGGGRQRGRRR